MKAARILIALVIVGGIVAGAVLLAAPKGEGEESGGASGGELTSAQCASCHEQAAKDHAADWHSQAFTDPDALKLSKNFQDEQCVSCHAPTPIYKTGIGMRVFARRERREEGVNCVSCHLREDGTVAAGADFPDSPCRARKDDFIGVAKHCNGCHNQHWTVDEFMAWKARTGRPETCIDCHTPHKFEGGHSLRMLKAAVTLSAEVEDAKLVVKVTNSGAGHKIPTDSRHKSFNLLVTVKDAEGDVLTLHEELAEYRLYYRQQNIDSTQILPGETREHEFVLPDDRKGTVIVDLVYCLKPPEKMSKEWTPVDSVELPF